MKAIHWILLALITLAGGLLFLWFGGKVGGDPSTSIRKPAFRAIDMHTHLHPASLPQVVKIMDRLGIELMVNLSGGSFNDHLKMQLQAAKQFPGRFIVFTSPDFSLLFTPQGPQKIAAMFRKAIRAGARGLKIHKGLGLRVRDPKGKLVPVDTPLLDPLWKAAGELGVPVSIHTGDPKAFFVPLTKKNERYAELSLNPHWSFADRKKYPTWDALYQQFLRLVKRHPKTTFVGVHFGNNPEDVVTVGKMMDKYPNLYTDLAARIPEIGRQKASVVRDVFIRHQDRLLFATDFSVWIAPVKELQKKAKSKKPLPLDVVPGHPRFAFSYTLGAPQSFVPLAKDVDNFFFRHWTYLQTAYRKMKNPTPIQGAWPMDGISLPKKILKKLYRDNAIKLLKLKPKANK